MWEVDITKRVNVDREKRTERGVLGLGGWSQLDSEGSRPSLSMSLPITHSGIGGRKTQDGFGDLSDPL